MAAVSMSPMSGQSMPLSSTLISYTHGNIDEEAPALTSKGSIPENGKVPSQTWLEDIPNRSFLKKNNQKEDNIKRSVPMPLQPDRKEGHSNVSLPSDESTRQSLSGKKSSVNNICHKIADSVNIDDDNIDSETAPVPQFDYFHQRKNSEVAGSQRGSPVIPTETGLLSNHYLTPTSHFRKLSSIPRPASTYSDFGPGTRSPGNRLSSSPLAGGRVPSNSSGNFLHDGRPKSAIDLANISYPQPPPIPISLDNSQLRSAVGSNASLLSTAKTIEMYRQNVKKLNDNQTQYAFAIFLVQAAQEAGLSQELDQTTRKPSTRDTARDSDPLNDEASSSSPLELLQEAKHILQRLSNQSYPFAQYYLADGYVSGLFNKGKEDYSTAFPLFVAASKHGHAESGYRAALCYEFGWGCRKDPAKAVQFYRQSASKNHPGSMTRLGRACLSGDLGLNKYREGIKWLKRASETADVQYNSAPYHLGILYQQGYGEDVFRDEAYAAQLFTQAADLGHSEACFLLGDAYENGKLQCPRDPALSIHFYTNAAQAGHPGAMMALCAWYIVGADSVLEKDEYEAYEWARRAADCG